MRDPFCFIDTAILVRYLTRDVEPLASQAGSLVAAVEREEISVQLSVTVILETVYAMTTHYGADRASLADGLSSLLALKGMLIPDKAAAIEALHLWANIKRLSFPDAYHLVLASHTDHKQIASFDKGVDNCLPGVTRIEQFP